MDMVVNELQSFTKKFLNSWQEKYSSLPQTEFYLGLPSPCVVQETEHFVLWQAIQRDSIVSFSNIETALNLKIHPDIKSFYGSQYCADMHAKWENQSIFLVQVWSDEDLERLQQNIIGHLLMQKKLNQSPTLFIASTENELDIISLCNQTGNVIKEKVGTDQREILTDSLASFLSTLTPKVD